MDTVKGVGGSNPPVRHPRSWRRTLRSVIRLYCYRYTVIRRALSGLNSAGEGGSGIRGTHGGGRPGRAKRAASPRYVVFVNKLTATNDASM